MINISNKNQEIKKTNIKFKSFKINHFSPPPNWWWYARIDKRVKNTNIKNYLKKLAMGKLLYGGDWDKKSIYFNNTDWFIKIQNLKKNLKNVESSLWYCEIIKSIKIKGYYQYKDKKIYNEQETIDFFENKILRLIKSLNKNGFLINKTDLSDIPKILIGRNGELIKSGNGCHRLAIIKIFDVMTEFPVQIVGIHKIFLNNDNLNYDYDRIIEFF